MWGVPYLLMDNDKQGIIKKLKNFLNPMFIAMIIGMIFGIGEINVPSFLNSVVTSAGNCMSPIAMLLTGMTIAKFDIASVLKIKSVNIISLLRLLVLPLLFIVFIFFVPGLFSKTFIICAVCSLAMPLGLNTIVIPSAYGKDTKVSSGMAIVSHVLSCITIPIIFMILNKVLT